VNASAPGPASFDPADPWGYRGRRCVVTGAASGMGRAAAEILVGVGAQVVGVDIQPIEADGLAGRHLLDLADPAQISAVAAAIAAPVDALFNCAGIPGTADARTVVAVNFAGMRRFTEALVPAMPAGAAVCCVGSTAAVNWPYHAEVLRDVVEIDDVARTLAWFDEHLGDLGYPYDVSKEAVNLYTATRAIGLNELGVRINCINPGSTRTPASREFTRAVTSKVGGAEMIEHWPRLMSRMAQPSEQAWAMVFLNSPFASFVTGASLYVDAGLTSGLVAGLHHPKVAAGMFWTPPVPSGHYRQVAP
jgi:NAD(P)-dependent dehydrogenase (short-subunit alcohol dehydrogenase family)